MNDHGEPGRGGRFASTRAASIVWCVALYAAAGVASVFIARGIGAQSAVAFAAAADLAATLIVFAGSVLFDNSSLYDPYWSVAPIPIAAYWLVSSLNAGHPFTLRALVVLALVAAWAIRLTYNWLRRWRGIVHEDWRYGDFRRYGTLPYWLVSFVGFHLFPTVLVFLGCLSLYPVLTGPARGINLIDVAALVVTIGAIWIESASDRELRAFLRKRTAEDEILTTGLWAYSRHPNYFGEVLFWWGLYLFALGADARAWWAAVGPVAITLLFLFVSVPMMDRHMTARHPGYADSMHLRSPLPLWFRRSESE